jgi:hypothetical protein
VQDPGLQHAPGQLHRPVERLEAGRGTAGVDKPDSQGGQHVGFELNRAQLAGQPQGHAQFADSRLDVTELAKDDARRLMRDARLARAGPGREHRARLGQRRLGAGQR